MAFSVDGSKAENYHDAVSPAAEWDNHEDRRVQLPSPASIKNRFSEVI